MESFARSESSKFTPRSLGAARHVHRAGDGGVTVADEYAGGFGALAAQGDAHIRGCGLARRRLGDHDRSDGCDHRGASASARRGATSRRPPACHSTVTSTRRGGRSRCSEDIACPVSRLGEGQDPRAVYGRRSPRRSPPVHRGRRGAGRVDLDGEDGAGPTGSEIFRVLGEVAADGTDTGRVGELERLHATQASARSKPSPSADGAAPTRPRRFRRPRGCARCPRGRAPT